MSAIGKGETRSKPAAARVSEGGVRKRFRAWREQHAYSLFSSLGRSSVDMLQAASPRSVSVVLNKVDFARNKYYYSRYYGHQYKNYYAGVSA